MSRHTIPAKEVITCDACGAINPQMIQKGRLTLKQDALDWGGNPCADGTTTLDLCDKCLLMVNMALDAVLLEIKNTRLQKTTP